MKSREPSHLGSMLHLSGDQNRKDGLSATRFDASTVFCVS